MNGLLSLLYDKPKDPNKSKSEFEMYLNSDLRLDDNADLFEFWIQQREHITQLFQLAEQVLIIPASNTCVERMFSVSGATVTEKRTRLTIEKIDKMIFLNRKLLYLRSLHETNGNELSDNTFHLQFSSDKCALTSDISSSRKDRRLSADDEAMFNEPYEEIHSDDDNGNDDKGLF